MGRCKQLLPLDGVPAIVRALEPLTAAGLAEVVVMVPRDGREIEAALRGFPVTVQRAGEGEMADTVRCGLAALTQPASGLVVALADHPLVGPKTIPRLVALHREHPDDIIIPTHQGKKGHPVLFPLRLLKTMASPATLRDLIRADPGRVRLVETDDPGILLDMDTPEDYRRLAELATNPPLLTAEDGG